MTDTTDLPAVLIDLDGDRWERTPGTETYTWASCPCNCPVDERASISYEELMKSEGTHAE